jgi:hypothetical protein
MSEATLITLVLLFIAILVIAIAIGAVRAFRKAFFLSLILLIFITPVFILWALIEGLFLFNRKKETELGSK